MRYNQDAIAQGKSAFELKKMAVERGMKTLLDIILSFVVGFILLAIYLPIFDLMKLLHK